MTTWQQLIQQGVLGTDRLPSAPTLPATLAQALVTDGQSQSTQPVPEEYFLQTAVLLAQYKTAGQQPQTLASAAQLTVVTPAPAEATPPIAEQRTALLRQLLRDFDQKLVIEWLGYCAQHKQAAPTDLLPLLLERATKELKLATALTPCLGERGRWLLTLNPAWQQTAAVTLAEEAWQTGSTAARTTFLTTLRAQNPTAARETLAAVWPTEAATERATFLATLQTELSSGDIPFLEEALADRSRTVRAEAIRLLLRLPSTALRQRVLATLTTYIGVERKWLKRQLMVKLPTNFVEEWQGWGVREQSPLGVRIGQKAGWLVQLIALVPPSAVVEAMGLDAVELLELIRSSDYVEALLTALLEGAEAHQDYPFLLAELHHLLRLLALSQIGQSEFVERFARYAPILPAAERLTLLQQYLSTTTLSAFGDWATLQLVLRSFSSLSPAITAELLTKQLPALIRRNTGDYGIGRILIELAYQLDPTGYPQAIALFQRRQGEEQPEYVGHFLQTYRLRHQMAQVFANR